MRTLFFASLAAVAATASGSVAAQTVNEVGDAGELVGTAQQIPGAVTQISGSLINLSALGEMDDIDMFRFFVTDPNAFSVTVSADLSEDNDGQLFLFDDAGQFIATDDDGGAGLLPQFNAGTLSGNSEGFYNLAFNLYGTQPILVANMLTGWSRDPDPFQTGPYTLNITGAGGQMGAVPEPSTWAMMLLGFGFVGGAMRSRRRQKVAVSYA